ncbi:MAG: sulfite oxidase heme-binding subunit YedZ [Vicinamibacterales bacterium]
MKGAKAAVFAACLLPLASLVWRTLAGDLGANPIEAVTLATGRWTLRLLLVTLAVTPVRRVTGWNRLVGFRRMLGLFAFFYATLHFAIYLAIDQFFDWETIVEDVTKRPFITAGFAAFVLLIPLAVTSTKGWIRRLGRRWQQLHRLIYVSAMLAVVHFIWKVKSDLRDPLFYATILAILLVARAGYWISRRPAASRSPAQRVS